MDIEYDKYYLGQVHLRGEGAPMHPDDPCCGIYPNQETRMAQAKAYYDHYNRLDEWEAFKKAHKGK